MIIENFEKKDKYANVIGIILIVSSLDTLYASNYALWPLILLDIIYLIIKTKITIHKNMIVILLPIAIWVIMSITWSNVPSFAFEGAVKFLILILFIVFNINYFNSYNISFISHLKSLRIYILLSIMIYSMQIFYAIYKIGFEYLGSEYFKYSLLFAYKINSNSISAVIVCYSCVIILFIVNNKNNYINYIIFILCMFDLYSLASFASLWSFCIALSLYLILIFMRKFRGISIIFLFFISLIIMVVLLSYNSIHSISVKTILEVSGKSDFSGRVYLWEEAWNVIKQYPIKGIGINSWKLYHMNNYYNAFTDSIVSGGVHNMYLQTWLEYGLVGMIYIIYLLVMVSKKIIKCSNYNKNKYVTLLFFISIIIRNCFESNNLIGGSIDNSGIFISWYLAILFYYSLDFDNCNSNKNINKDVYKRVKIR